MHFRAMLLLAVAACLALAVEAQALVAPSSTLSAEPGTAFTAPTPAPQLAARATTTVAGRTYVVTRRITTTRRGTRAATATIDVVEQLARKSGLSKGAVAGIGLAAVALLVALGCAACWCRRRRRARRSPLSEPIDDEELEGAEKKLEQPEPLAYTASLDIQHPASFPPALAASDELATSPYPPSSAAVAFPMPSPPEPAYTAAGHALASSISAPLLQLHSMPANGAPPLGPSLSTPLLRVFPAPPLPPAGFVSEGCNLALPSSAAAGGALAVPDWPPRGSSDTRPTGSARPMSLPAAALEPPLLNPHDSEPQAAGAPLPNPHEPHELGGCGPPAYVPADAAQTTACEKHLPGHGVQHDASSSSTSAAASLSDRVA